MFFLLTGKRIHAFIDYFLLFMHLLFAFSVSVSRNKLYYSLLFYFYLFNSPFIPHFLKIYLVISFLPFFHPTIFLISAFHFYSSLSIYYLRLPSVFCLFFPTFLPLVHSSSTFVLSALPFLSYCLVLSTSSPSLPLFLPHPSHPSPPSPSSLHNPTLPPSLLSHPAPSLASLLTPPCHREAGTHPGKIRER